jgi:hypothetical protein
VSLKSSVFIVLKVSVITYLGAKCFFEILAFLSLFCGGRVTGERGAERKARRAERWRIEKKWLRGLEYWMGYWKVGKKIEGIERDWGRLNEIDRDFGKIGRLGYWKVGMMEGWSIGMMEWMEDCNG